MTSPSRELIEKCRSGDENAFNALWNDYYRPICAVARTNLPTCDRRIQDEEDVALVVLAEFFRGLSDGAHPIMRCHDDIWPLLVTMTIRRALNVRRANRRDRTEQVRNPNAHAALNTTQSVGPLSSESAILRDMTECLFDLLTKEQTQIADLRMSGGTIVEIAEELGMSKSRIHRQLQVIRIKAARLFDQ